MGPSKKGKKKKAAPEAEMQLESEAKLSEHLEMQRTRTICGPDTNYHVHTMTSALMYMCCGVDNSWDHAKWSKDFGIKVTSMSDESLEFEMMGIDPALANAMRRCLIAEVPTVAIEHVFFIDNTSIMQEEVLSHRLGLVPLAISPDALETKGDTAKETNTVVFKLHKKCTKAEDGSLVDDVVYSSDLKWLPSGSEYPDETGTRFAASQPESLDARPVHSDILLCKLRPGQEIELEAHAVRGLGSDHSKFSPVATAWYRMYPEIVVLKEVPDQLALDLSAEVPKIFSVKTRKGKPTLVVANAREHEDEVEKVRHMTGQDKYREYIQVRKRKEHFIFTIETAGSIPPAQLFVMALNTLKEKCLQLEEKL